ALPAIIPPEPPVLSRGAKGSVDPVSNATEAEPSAPRTRERRIDETVAYRQHRGARPGLCDRRRDGTTGRAGSRRAHLDDRLRGGTRDRTEERQAAVRRLPVRAVSGLQRP